MGTETAEPLDLVVFSETQTSVEVFTGGGMAAVLDGIERKVREAAADLDVSTEDGRAKIRSVAYKVARTKTALDAEGKRLTEEWRKNTAKVNEERRKSSDRLEALADEVRRPLTEFEEKERRRVAAHEAALVELGGILNLLQPGGTLAEASSAALKEHLLDYTKFLADHDWEEFGGRATKIRKDVQLLLVQRIMAKEQREKDQAELARLRAIEEARQREEQARLERERIERLQADAAKEARLDAERRAAQEAEAERQRVQAAADAARLESERLLREAEERAAAERDRLENQRRAEEQARIDAEERTKAAERQREEDRIAAEERATQERIAAEQRLADAKKKSADDAKKASEKARKDREAALQVERDRVTAENVAAQLAQRRREEDEANKARVRAEIVEDLDLVDGLESAGEIADLILAGRVRHVRVQW